MKIEELYKRLEMLEEHNEKEAEEGNEEALGNVEVYRIATWAVGRQIPMNPKLSCEKPIKHKMVYECGKCGGKFLGTTAEYCSHCGQRIDWEGIRASE